MWTETFTLFDIETEEFKEAQSEKRVSEITIQYESREYRYKNTDFVPKITLSGKYLRKYRF